MGLTKEKRELVYIEIINMVKMDIARGRYKNGTRLPSVRQYAKELSVNPNTVQKALLFLEDEGYLYTRRTAGRYVTNNLRSISNLKDELTTSKLQVAIESMLQIGYTKEQVIEKTLEVFDMVQNNESSEEE